MRIQRAASIPLVLHDPFFSIWSSADHLYDDDPVHWSGIRQQLRGYLTVDGKVFSFLGDKEIHEVIPQVSVDVTATATEYVFENELVSLKCKFTSPLLLDDMVLVSRPCTYVDFKVNKKQATEVTLDFEVSSDLVKQSQDTIVGHDGKRETFSYSFMGRAQQYPLGGSGDNIAIDWGYVYLACQEENAAIYFDRANEKLRLKMTLDSNKPAGFVIAFDDLLSINYFGQWRKAYWTKEYSTILDAIDAAFADKKETLEKAEKLDREIEAKAYELGGDAYVFLCNMSYRQSIAAHKLIEDEEGNVIFLSKENNSNGCIGTVDVSYPSIPLFMLYDTEYVKGMMRPIFKFAACDVWEYDFAPHDVGRYPYAWGQVYGWKPSEGDELPGGGIWAASGQGVYPPFYMYPAGTDNFNFESQMPVEECGNMLIMSAVVSLADGNAEFIKPHWNVLTQWKNYLVKYGADPGNQLCTDDFAGHLAHNVNLSAKAIMGIEAYAMLADMLGDKAKAQEYHKVAKEMAASWEERADAGDHYKLTFDKDDSWSMKYNIVWDKIWSSNLFSDDVYEKELAYYIKMADKYGTPLDNRASYTKSDWILWCATMAKDKEQAEQLIRPIADYLENTSDRIPFGDWYDVKSGLHYHFIARSVQGGVFMPMMYDSMKIK